MALSQQKRAAVSGDEEYVVRMYSTTNGGDYGSQPVIEIKVRKKIWDQLSAGEKTDINTALAVATLNALAYTS